MTISATLFDLDGTLVDSLADLTDAVNHMLTGFGRQQLHASQLRQMVGKGARNLIQQALDSHSPEEIQRGLAAFTEFNTLHIADKSRLYPGVRELLQQLADSGMRLAVISNKQEALSRLIMQELGIDAFFERIVGGDTFPELKPSPLPLLKVIDEFCCTPAETVMVGDSINDILAGQRAGITTIGCNWGYGNSEELREAEFSADSCSDIFKILGQLD